MYVGFIAYKACTYMSVILVSHIYMGLFPESVYTCEYALRKEHIETMVLLRRMYD